MWAVKHSNRRSDLPILLHLAMEKATAYTWGRRIFNLLLVNQGDKRMRSWRASCNNLSFRCLSANRIFELLRKRYNRIAFSMVASPLNFGEGKITCPLIILKKVSFNTYLGYLFCLNSTSYRDQCKVSVYFLTVLLHK